MKKYNLSQKEKKILQESFTEEGFKVVFNEEQVIFEKEGKTKTFTNKEIIDFLREGIKIHAVAKSRLIFKGIGTPPL